MVLDKTNLHDNAPALADFIYDSIAGLPGDQLASSVYVLDQDGNQATSAYFEKQTLTDGSHTFNLVIVFPKPVETLDPPSQA